jgi:hypothetical protein
MKQGLFRIAGATLAATISLWGASLSAEDVIVEKTVTPTTPAVVEKHTTTTTTSPAPVIQRPVVERPIITEDAAEELGDIAEERREAREEIADEIEDDLD